MSSLVPAAGGVSLGTVFATEDSAFLLAPWPSQTPNDGKQGGWTGENSQLRLDPGIA